MLHNCIPPPSSNFCRSPCVTRALLHTGMSISKSGPSSTDRPVRQPPDAGCNSDCKRSVDSGCLSPQVCQWHLSSTNAGHDNLLPIHLSKKQIAPAPSNPEAYDFGFHLNIKHGVLYFQVSWKPQGGEEGSGSQTEL